MRPVSAIAFDGTCKYFGSVVANEDVTFDVAEGEIHAVVGENGAGKSTLLKMLYGHLRPDRGSIRLAGRPVGFRSPRDAIRAGIGMVHQHVLVFPRLTGWENVLVGDEPAIAGRLRTVEARERVIELCTRYGMDLTVDAPAQELPFAERQQIELLRILHRGARVILLDEPTSLFSPIQVERFLALMERLKKDGRTILFVSHRLDEVMAVSDRITVLRRGRREGTYLTGITSHERIVRSMVFGNGWAGPAGPGGLAESKPREASPERRASLRAAKPVVVLQALNTGPMGREAGLNGIDLRIRQGEIFGIGGVVGNGQRTLAAALAGYVMARNGRCLIDNQDVTDWGVLRRSGLGVTWLPGNPRDEALVPEWSLWENVLLTRQHQRTFQNRGILRKGNIRHWAENELKIQNAVYRDLAEPLATLSGGNMQKAVLARVLAGRPRLAILEQPGRGLDIHALDRLHRHIRVLNAYGTTFVLISYDLDELLALCDRVGILYRGKLMGITEREDFQPGALAQWMVGAG